MKNKLGAFFTCFDELEATRFSLHNLRRVYPKVPICLFYENNMNFKFLETELPNLITNQEEDTLSLVFKLNPGNYQLPENQIAIKKATIAVIERLYRASLYLNSEYIIMLDPDAVISGPLTIPNEVGLLGSRINKNLGQLNELNKVLVKYSGISLTNWGATPAILNTEKFLKGREILLKNPTLVDEMCASFYAMFAHDILLPSIFSLIGESETLNPDIVECTRNPEWMKSGKPLIHQYREYYPKRKTKYHVGNW